MEAFELIGCFWLPEDEDNLDKHFAGILKFNPIDGGSLELIHGEPFNSRFYKKTHPIILGVIKGIEYTLINCNNPSYNLPDIFTKYKIEYIIKGKNYNNIQDVKFNDIYLTIAGLNNWANNKIFSNDIINGENILKISQAVQYKAVIQETMNIEFWVCADGKGDSHNSWDFRKNPFFKIDFKQSKSISEVKKIVDHFNDFIIFTTMKSNYITNLKSDNDNIVFYFRRKYKIKELISEIHPYSMLFNLNDILEIGFEAALKNWFAEYEELNHIYRLFLLPDYTNSVLEVSFLSMAQALDSYISFFLRCKGFDKEKTSKKEKEIILSNYFQLNETEYLYKDLLKKYPSFGSLIKIFLKEYKMVFAGINNIEDFIKIIKETRNALSHGHSDEEKESNQFCFTDENLIWLYYGVKMILSAVFLRRIGFDDNKIIESLKRYFWYKNILKGDFKFKIKSN